MCASGNVFVCIFKVVLVSSLYRTTHIYITLLPYLQRVQGKIDSMQKLLSDLAAKRSSFEGAFARSEGELRRKRDDIIGVRQRELQDEVLRLLREAAKVEGWEVEEVRGGGVMVGSVGSGLVVCC